jgi:hypothetical protein
MLDERFLYIYYIYIYVSTVSQWPGNRNLSRFPRPFRAFPSQLTWKIWRLLGLSVLISYSVPGSPRSALVPDSGTTEGPHIPYAESSSHRPLVTSGL